MTFTAQQYNFVDEPSRFFLMDATRSGLPVDVLHVFRGDSATMRVRLLSAFPMIDAHGPRLTSAETVTLFNDLCVLAPGALIDPAIQWTPVDDRTARARFTVGSDTISAVLSFNDAGELVDFVSDDRLMVSGDGAEFTRLRWSTPLSDYRDFGERRVSSHGEGHWHPAEGGEYAYIELELVDLEVNGGWALNGPAGHPLLAPGLHVFLGVLRLWPQRAPLTCRQEGGGDTTHVTPARTPGIARVCRRASETSRRAASSL